MHCPQCRFALIRRRDEHTALVTRAIEIRKSDGRISLTCPRCRVTTALPPEISAHIRSMVLVAVPAASLAEAH